MSENWFDMDDLTSFLLGEGAIEGTAEQPDVGSEGAAQHDGVAQSQPPKERKRRITKEQVRQLETSFNLKNKLGPNQKSELAMELGLEPRQVLVWFQNRRARTKGKQLEKEYYKLKDHYYSLKVDYDYLQMETERLRNQASMLSNKLKMRKEEESNPGSMNGSMSPVEGDKLLVEPALPPQEDPLKGLEPPSMEYPYVFGFGQSEGDVFDSAFGENFDFVLSGIDDQSTWCPELGF